MQDNGKSFRLRFFQMFCPDKPFFSTRVNVLLNSFAVQNLHVLLGHCSRPIDHVLNEAVVGSQTKSLPALSPEGAKPEVATKNLQLQKIKFSNNAMSKK